MAGGRENALHKGCLVTVLLLLSFLLPVLPADAGITDRWVCTEEAGGGLRCSGPGEKDEYEFSFFQSASGGGFSDTLRSSSFGITLLRTCEDFHTSFRRRSCRVDISAAGDYAERLREVFGPGGSHLILETRGPALDVWAGGGESYEEKEQRVLLFSSEGTKQKGVLAHAGLLDKIRRDFVSHYADPLDNRQRQPGIARETLFREWLDAVYSDESMMQWKDVIRKEQEVSRETSRHSVIQWWAAVCGLLLNGLTGYAFYRNRKTKSLFLKTSLFLLLCAAALFLVGIHPSVLAASFGFWSGLTFPFSLLAYPGLELIKLLRGVIEFEMLVQIVVAFPVLILSAAGSYVMWTRVIPCLALKKENGSIRSP